MRREGSVLPLHGLELLVVLTDVAHELSLESGTEVKTLRAITSRSILANPQFDLVEPRLHQWGSVWEWMSAFLRRLFVDPLPRQFGAVVHTCHAP
jgi:hypothetical protein